MYYLFKSFSACIYICNFISGYVVFDIKPVFLEWTDSIAINFWKEDLTFIFVNESRKSWVKGKSRKPQNMGY